MHRGSSEPVTSTAVRPKVPAQLAQLGFSGLFVTPVSVDIPPSLIPLWSARHLRRLRNDGWLVLSVHQWFGDVWAVMVRRDENAIVDVATGRLEAPEDRMRRDLVTIERDLRG